MGGTESRIAPPIVKKWRNGNMREQIFPSGLRRSWYEDGTKESETQPDGTNYVWHPNGRLRREKFMSGAVKEYNIKGILVYEKTINGDEYIYDDNGKLEIKKIRNSLGIVIETEEDIMTS